MNAAPYCLRPLSKNLSGDGSRAERPVLYLGIKRWRGGGGHGSSLYHLGARRSIRVIGAGQRTLTVIYGRCRTVRLLHFAAAPFCDR